MKLRQRAHQRLTFEPTSGAFFAVAFFVAGTALAGRMVTAWRTYEPRPGLVCPNDGGVDFSQLAGPAPHWKPHNSEEQAFFEASRRHLANKPWQGEPGVRVRTLGTLQPFENTIAVSKSPSGQWILTLDRKAGRLDDEKEHAEVALSKTQGDIIERMLADPCLYAEPDLIGTAYPVRDGVTGQCFDGSTTYLYIQYAGRRRTAVQACSTHGLTGELADFLYRPFSEADAQAPTI